MPNIGQIEPFSPLMKEFTYIDKSNTPNHRNSIPSPATFAESVDGNFYEFPWVRDNFVTFESI